MKQKAGHRRKTYNKFWKDPKAIIGFGILIFGSAFTCGTYYQKNESNLEILKIRGEYNNTLNEERNQHTVELCKYENALSKQK